MRQVSHRHGDNYSYREEKREILSEKMAEVSYFIIGRRAEVVADDYFEGKSVVMDKKSISTLRN